MPIGMVLFLAIMVFCSEFEKLLKSLMNVMPAMPIR